MRKVPLLASALLLLSPAGNVYAQTVKVNWQMQAPFTDYRTYEWKESKNQGSDFYSQWVHKDVDDQLTKKGLQKVSAEQNPDIYVYYHVVAQEVIDSTTTDDGFGWGGVGRWGYWGGWGGWGGPDIAHTEAQPRFIGILAVDIVDAKKKELVWRGQATTDSISNNQSGDEKQVLKAVDKMLKQFPPTSKE